MKRIIFASLVLLMAAPALFAQNEVDALRYSWQIPGGTARTTAMGGAFGALGGDITSMGTNPAGLGVYQQSDFSFTPSFEFINSGSKFLDNNSDDFDYNFNVNSFGYVGTSKFNKDGQGLKNLNFGFGYTRLNNYHQNILVNGDNPYNSMTDWFAERACGNHYSQLQYNDNFYSSLAWETYLINQVSLTDTMNYVGIMNGKYGQNQTHTISRDGYQGEYDISLAANFNHMVYFGASFGIQPVRFEQSIFHTEADVNDSIPDFNSFTFQEHLYTRGSGINFKFGVLVRPVEWVRIGGAIHSPTFYNLSDEYSSEISSKFVTPEYSQTWYSNQGYYDYQLTTPFKAIANVAFIIGKVALVSIDYDYTNYSLARLRAYDYTFVDENNSVKTEYQGAHNLKAGVEYRLGYVSFRAGAAYFGSPYKPGHINEDAYQMMYTGGIGFRGKSFYFDIAYARIGGIENYYMYEGVVTSPVAEITKANNRIVTTLGFKF
ncbi:MAG: hypothetical protein KA793_04070 [Bacteroidales bacterium]|nr:hypothetical protein [Bacteroidales bacterium]